MNTSTQTDKRATVTFHTTPETKERLDALATITSRSRSFLTNKAVERYLAEEEDLLAAVHEGLADANVGHVHTANEVKQYAKKHFAKK